MAMKNVKKVVALLMAASVMSIGSVSFALETSFSQDFEKYNPDAITTDTFTWGTNTQDRLYINNGKLNTTDDTYPAAANTLWIFDGNITETNSAIPTDSWTKTKAQLKEKGFLTDNMYQGGLEGYLGITQGLHMMPSGYYDKSGAERTVYPLFVLKENSTNKYLSMYSKGNDGNQRWLWFGKEGLDLYGKKVKVSFRLKAQGQGIDTSASDRIGLMIARDMTNSAEETIESTIAKTNYGSAPVGATVLRAQKGEISDLINIKEGKVYVGLPSTETEVCSITMNADQPWSQGAWFTFDVYLDYTNTTAPTVTAVVKNAEGNVLGRKTGAMPIVTVDNNVKGATSLTAFVSNYEENKYFNYTTGAGTYPDNGQALFVEYYTERDGQTIYLDDFSMVSGVEYKALAEISGTISGNAVSATVTPGSTAATNAKLFAAEFDATSGRCLQIAPAQDVSYAALGAAQTPTVTFSNALTEGSKVKLYLWDSFTNIHPLANAVTVR